MISWGNRLITLTINILKYLSLKIYENIILQIFCQYDWENSNITKPDLFI